MDNPFKYGSIVEGGFFTNRTDDLVKVAQVIQSSNHLILISPRRYGKTSLINKAVVSLNRPVVFLNLQLVTSTSDFATELLKRILSIYKIEKIKHFFKDFRFVPTISLNPVSNNFDISFAPMASAKPILEDVLTLIETLGKKGKKPIVIFDEFQEIRIIDKLLDKQLRSIIQHHQCVNYVFMGSQESLMRDIFERKKSPFYHFGTLQTLDVIPYLDFEVFLKTGFSLIHKKSASEIAKDILLFTQQHPYYTQMMAYHYFNALLRNKHSTLQDVILSIVREHNMDYERLWMNLNLKDRELILELIYIQKGLRTVKNNTIPTSTRYSAYKRLLQNGYLIQAKEGYKVEDPFFATWLMDKREQMNVI
ncbi:MAG: ATP-binding protein [Bacteroidales bacterium]|nr:ATP-binding protein [Bacteroidales bacterium]